MNLYQHAKNQLHLFIFEIQSILESKKPIGQTHILAMPNQKIFELLIIVNLYQHAKNEAVLSIRCDWLSILAFISDFSQI